MSNKHPPNLGATKKFPQGHTNAEDEGELRFALATDFEHGVVMLDFGTAVQWMGLPPALARQLGEKLIQKANELEQHPLPGLPQ